MTDKEIKDAAENAIGATTVGLIDITDELRDAWIIGAQHVLSQQAKGKSDIYSGDLNAERIKQYKNLSELFTVSEMTVREIFCKDADWALDLPHLNTQKEKCMNCSSIDDSAGCVCAKCFLDVPTPKSKQ